MKLIFKIWVGGWLAVLVGASLWVAMVIGSYMVREMEAGLGWLAAVLAFLMVIFTLVGLRLALIWAAVLMGRISARLAWRDVRNLGANLVFFSKTGWLK